MKKAKKYTIDQKDAFPVGIDTYKVEDVFVKYNVQKDYINLFIKF